MKKKILVTGASGLVGSHLINAMDPSEYEVYAVSRRRPNGTQHHHLALDFAADWSIDQLPSSVDHVVHLAQSEDFRQFPDRVEDIFAVNTLSTLKLADYARKTNVDSFIYTSSAGVYGNGKSRFVENEEIVYKHDLGFYLGTKLSSEIILENYQSWFNVVTLRLFFVYGLGQREDMLIPRLVGFVRDGKPIILQGNDGIRITPTHVDDVVQSILNTLDLKSSQKINIAGPEILSLRDIGDIIGTALEKNPQFNIENKESNNLIGDISKMKSLLHTPEITFRKGIKTLLD